MKPFTSGHDVYRQSDDDKTLYIVYSGEIRLIHIDPTGVPNDVGQAQPGRMLGESSLLLAEPHDVTALALTEVVTLAFKRETFMPLREQYPRLWGRLNPSDPVAKRLNAPHYGWQAADEAVVLFTRQHWWGLLRRMFFPLIALLGIAALLIIIQQSLPSLLGLAVVVGCLDSGRHCALRVRRLAQRLLGRDEQADRPCRRTGFHSQETRRDTAARR